MKSVLYILLFYAGISKVNAQNCTNLDFPVGISDSCEHSPLFCGSYLRDYCSSNYGLTDDSFGLKSGFLRLSPCDDKFRLEVSVFDCLGSNNALTFSLYEEKCDTSNVITTITVAENSTDTLSADSLLELHVYQLAISGLQGSECRFNIKVIDGIGTADPGPVECSCTSEAIEGPKTICMEGPAKYSVKAPNCFFSFGLPVGGNGIFCPPPVACPGAVDSLVMNWHIPQGLHFVDGDSTGLDITVALDSIVLDNLDTIRNGSIYATWSYVSTQPVDPDVYCICGGLNCGAQDTLSMGVSLGLTVEYYTCTISCTNPTCTILGITYSTPGTFSYITSNCHLITVTIHYDPAKVQVPDKVICAGDVAVLTVSNPDPDFAYAWSNGASGTSIAVAPLVSTTYSVTATQINGTCQSVDASVVTVIVPAQLNLGQIGTISCSQPCVAYEGVQYCQPGTYSIVSPMCTTKVFVIAYDPTIQQDNLPDITLCEGDCYQFFDQLVCTSGTYTHLENCINYTQHINVLPSGIQILGVVATISCSQPCVTYNGVTYCDPGIYTSSTICGSKQFEIAFVKDVIDMGEIGKITCQQHCIDYGGVTYCQPGDYVISDSCSERHFSIGSSQDGPSYTPPFLDCLPSNTQFTVAFVIGGIPPFKVNGTPLVGNYFLSAPQQNGVPFTFIIEQSNGCAVVVSGKYDCAQFCNTDAGRLSADTLHGCLGEAPVQTQTTVLPFLAPGDTSLFTLQTANGTILDQNTSGAFSFNPATMSTETTYYAVLYAGPPDNVGFPDPMNACTDTSSHQPVVFHAKPDVSISGDSLLCEGDALDLNAQGAIHYLWNTGWTGAELLILETDSDDSDTYWVVGTTYAGCSAMDSVSVEVKPAESAGCCKLKVPNAFTPNGDGANDSFAPILPDCNKLLYAEMRVYSRWGTLVYESRGNNLRWDGLMPEGLPAASDTYIFTFRYRLEGDEEITEKGEITLLR